MLNSSVSIPAAKVRHMAENTIKRIQNARNAAVNRALDEIREDYRKSWWRRLFRRPIPTDAEILKSMDTDMIQLMYYNQEQVAQRLLKACNYSDTILVSTEDLGYL